MSSASASSTQRLPVASQGANRAEPGKNNLKVATYNIGAKPDESFQGPGKAIFRAKLQEDIATLTGEGIHILCLQEVSSKWEGDIRKMLPTGWEILWADYCLTAFHGPS